MIIRCFTSLSIVFNSFGAKFQTTFVVCFFYFNKLSFGKTYICKVERLNVKQRRSRWDGSLSHLIWIYAVCKSLLLSPVAVKESSPSDGSVKMKGSMQWSVIQSRAEFRLQQDSNPGPCETKSGVLPTWPTFLVLLENSTFLSKNGIFSQDLLERLYVSHCPMDEPCTSFVLVDRFWSWCTEEKGSYFICELRKLRSHPCSSTTALSVD